MTVDPLAGLLLRVARQDRAAFRALYADTSAMVMGVLLRLLGSRAEAEDALQEVFTRIWRHAGRFDPAKASAMPWLIALARAHAADLLRARPTTAPQTAEASNPPDRPLTLAARAEARRIDACFATLSDDRAAALRSAYLDGLSYPQLAARHGVPIPTMRTGLRRSLVTLRECLSR